MAVVNNGWPGWRGPSPGLLPRAVLALAVLFLSAAQCHSWRARGPSGSLPRNLVMRRTAGDPRRIPRAPTVPRAVSGQPPTSAAHVGQAAEREAAVASGDTADEPTSHVAHEGGHVDQGLWGGLFQGKLLSATLAQLPSSFMVKRTAQTWAFISSVVLRITVMGTSNGTDTQHLAREIRDGLLALGPTYIKLGQLLSTRVDVIPPVFLDELATLQDNCPPFPLEEVKGIIEADLGPNAFAQFDDEPLAAASLGQVHLATTKEGQRVAVKVQRPGLRELFTVDLKNLQVLAEVAMILDRTPDRILRDWREIFEQNARIIYEEIDYTREANNAVRFAENFKDVPWLRTPEPFLNLTSRRVLTMEYVPGTKISDIDAIDALGLDRRKLATYAAESYMIQLLRFGFFHCDPHPGNVAVEAVQQLPGGSPEPRIILYDYGMMGTLSPQLKKGIVKGVFGVYERDFVALADSLFEAGLIGEDTDRCANPQGGAWERAAAHSCAARRGPSLSVEIIARYFINTFSERFAMDVKKAPADREERTRMRVRAMQSIGQELAAIGGQKPFRYPEAFPSLLRAFTALEGIGKSLDKEYDVYRIARRYLADFSDLKEEGKGAITVVRSVQKRCVVPPLPRQPGQRIWRLSAAVPTPPLRLGLSGEDIAGYFTFPRKINELKRFTSRLESGEVKLRVRALEAERALFRSMLLQRASVYAIFACVSMNLGMWLSMSASKLTGFIRIFAAGFVYCIVRAVVCLVKLQSVLRDEENKYYNAYI